jgi:hypothetical protein
MVSAHPHTIDTTRQPPKLGDFFSPYQQQQQQQQQPTLNNYDISSNNNNGYENINFIPQGHHRPQSVTNLPLRQQNQNNALARQSQQQNRRSPLLNANNNPQFVNPLGRPPPLMSSPDGFLNQENPQLLQNRSNSQNSIPKNPKLYKTELCRSWMDHGRCNYGERCQYAHGTDEKRQIPRHPKYKTEACSSYHKTGYCPYGPRCHFIHNEDPALLRQLIAQNAAAMGTTIGSEQSSPTLTPTITQRPRNLNLHQTMSAPPSTVATPQQQQQHGQVVQQHQQCQRQHSTILPIGSRPSLPQTPQQQQQYFVQKQLDSDGESPIPSSTDSGSESPLGSFSPGLEDALCRLSPTSFRRSLSQTTTRWSPTSGLLPTTTTNSSAAVAGTNVVGNNSIGGAGIIFNSPNDPWNDSTLINSLSNLSFGNHHHHHQLTTPTTPIDNPWETSSTTTTTKTSSPAPPTAAAARLPVFERLSNNL